MIRNPPLYNIFLWFFSKNPPQPPYLLPYSYLNGSDILVSFSKVNTNYCTVLLFWAFWLGKRFGRSCQKKWTNEYKVGAFPYLNETLFYSVKGEQSRNKKILTHCPPTPHPLTLLSLFPNLKGYKKNFKISIIFYRLYLPDLKLFIWPDQCMITNMLLKNWGLSPHFF